MSPISPELEDDYRLLAEAARQATREAYERTLKSGVAATVAEGDVLYRVDPDGTRTKIADLPPMVSLTEVLKVKAS